ncbi:AAA family ATPase [Ningiella sp. W23]|uniref:AAA family ATPase n=1 Tax=Ningiella sp. W23 TaxID=3023715 RepID=UPI00375754FC
MIHIIFGPVGAGKTTLASSLCAKYKAINVSGDMMFKHLYIHDFYQEVDMSWIVERIDRINTCALELAISAFNSGTSVILDLGLALTRQRAVVHQSLIELNIPYQFYYIYCSAEDRKQRVIQRNLSLTKNEFFVDTHAFEQADLHFEVPSAQELNTLQAAVRFNEYGQKI